MRTALSVASVVVLSLVVLVTGARAATGRDPFSVGESTSVARATGSIITFERVGGDPETVGDLYVLDAQPGEVADVYDVESNVRVARAALSPARAAGVYSFRVTGGRVKAGEQYVIVSGSVRTAPVTVRSSR